MNTVAQSVAVSEGKAGSAIGRNLRLTAWQVLYEQRGFWRNRRRAMFSFAFPLMFLFIFGALNHGHISSRGNISYIDFYVPGIIAYAVMVIGFSNMAMAIALLKDKGILKRMRTTPMPTGAYLAGITLSTVITILAAICLLLAVGAGLFGAQVRLSTLPGLLASCVLGIVCFTTLGIAASRLIGNPDGGMPILMFITLPLSFISNVFFPLEGVPGWLNSLAKFFPLRPLADGLQAAFDHRTHGAGFVGHDLSTLAIWAVVGCYAMLKTVRALSEKD